MSEGVSDVDVKCCQLNVLLTALTQTHFNGINFSIARLTFFSNVDMTEDRDIPDRPLPYMRKIVGVKKDSWQMSCVPIVSFCFDKI